MRRTLATLLAALALAGGLAACGDDGGGDAASGDGGSGGGDGSKDRFCELASQEDIAGLEDFDPSEAESMDRLDEALTQLSDAAPDEIRDDVDTVAEGLRELVEILSTIDTSDPDALSELTERAEELEGMQQRMEASVERVDRYLEEECGIEPGS